MIEIKEDNKEIIKVERYPEGVDNIDRVIIDVYMKHQKPMSFTTLRNELFKEYYGAYSDFIARLERLEKKFKDSNCKVKLTLFKEKSEVLKVGSSDDKEKAKKNKTLIEI